MHEEHGPETHKLTAEILKDVWRLHILPAARGYREGESSMHRPDLPGRTSMPAGGSKEEPQSGNGHQHGVPDHNPGNIHHAAPANVDNAVPGGQASRQDNYEAQNTGVNSSHGGPQAGNGGQRQIIWYTNERLPPLMSLGLLPPGWERRW